MIRKLIIVGIAVLLLTSPAIGDDDIPITNETSQNFADDHANWGAETNGTFRYARTVDPSLHTATDLLDTVRVGLGDTADWDNDGLDETIATLPQGTETDEYITTIDFSGDGVRLERSTEYDSYVNPTFGDIDNDNDAEVVWMEDFDNGTFQFVSLERDGETTRHSKFSMSGGGGLNDIGFGSQSSDVDNDGLEEFPVYRTDYDSGSGERLFGVDRNGDKTSITVSYPSHDDGGGTTEVVFQDNIYMSYNNEGDQDSDYIIKIDGTQTTTDVVHSRLRGAYDVDDDSDDEPLFINDTNPGLNGDGEVPAYLEGTEIVHLGLGEVDSLGSPGDFYVTGSLDVQVYDVTGDPLSSQVTLRDESKTGSSLTFDKLLGAYTVTVEKDGYSTMSRNIQLRDGKSLEFTLYRANNSLYYDEKKLTTNVIYGTTNGSSTVRTVS